MLIRGVFSTECPDFDGVDWADGDHEVVDLLLFRGWCGGEYGDYFLYFHVDELLYGQCAGVGLGGLLDILEGLDDVLASLFLVARHEVESLTVVEVVGVAEGGVGGVGVVFHEPVAVARVFGVPTGGAGGGGGLDDLLGELVEGVAAGGGEAVEIEAEHDVAVVAHNRAED